MALPGQLAFDNAAEVQVLFRCVRSPTQHSKNKRRQANKCCETGKDLPEQTCRRWLGCARTR